MYDFDAVVVGSGPAGSVAAKVCAKNGLQTLLLEKRKLPRDKVCSGMLVGPRALKIIAEEFGPIPQQVLTDPSHLHGYMLHVPGVAPLRIDCAPPIAIGWRKEIDFWMAQKAKEAGAEIWDHARVVNVTQNGGVCTVTLSEGSQGRQIKSRFVIGADGTNSIVRKSLFPDLKTQYTYAQRECYEGELLLDKKYFHWVFPSGWYPCFGVHHKNNHYLLEGRVQQTRPKIVEVLAEYGFQADAKPLWCDACASRPGFLEDVFSGAFVPAQGNVLLAGDTTSLKIYSSGEGTGTALESGVLAAGSVVKALHSDGHASDLYMKELKPMVERMRAHYLKMKSFKEEDVKDPEFAIKALGELFTESMIIG